MIKPIDLKIKTVQESEDHGTYVFEPLPKGYGQTMGNVLRRVLLTSIEGSAVTQVTVKGVDHQFSTIEGIKEDVVEITLNLKALRFKNYSENAAVATLSASEEGVVTAADIECPSDLEVVNKDAVIATVTKKGAKLDLELLIDNGYGYSPSEERESSKVGVIILDALYSPVVKASYEVAPTRFGKSIDLDKLTLEVTTNGTISPKEALLEGSKTIKAFFERLVLWDEVEGVTEEDLEEVESTEGLVKEKVLVEDLPLPTRTLNALKKSGISSLQELASKNEEELLDIKNLGEKSLEEINKLLEKEDLS
jgi:DNA-directed RNA polymerase subunit alpha